MTQVLNIAGVEYAGDDSTQIFDIANNGVGIYYEATSEIVVSLVESSGETPQSEGTHYTVSASYTDEGTVTFLSAPTSSQRVRIVRNTPLTQLLTLTLAGAYNPANVMNALDKLTRIAQDQGRVIADLDGAEYVTLTEQDPVPTVAPDGKVILYCDGDGDLHAVDDAGNDVNLTTSAVAAAASAATATAQASAASASASSAATSAGAASSSATSAASSETASTAAQAAAESARDAAIAASETLAWGYEFDSDTTDADPGAGKFRFNNTSFAAATQMFISETADEGDISATMAVWDDSSSLIKATVKIRNPLAPTRWCEFYVSGTITDAGSYRKVPITPIAINDNDTIATTFPDETDVLLGVFRNGDAGTGAVDSWNGRTGSVSPAASDYDASQIDNDSSVAGAFVDDALNTLNTGKLGSVVEDTAPQLGGQLNVDGNAIGDGTNELLAFVEAASAVNELTISNAATGNAPKLSATGDDTNIDLDVEAKGTGSVKIASPQLNLGSDASGDIYYRDGSGIFQRLPKGTDGQILKLASGLPSWADGGGGAVEHLGTVTASNSATMEFTLPTGYFKFEIVVSDFLPATDGIEIRGRTSTDGGSTFDSSAGNYQSNIKFRTNSLGTNMTSEDHIMFAEAVGSATNEESAGTITIYNPSETNYTWMFGDWLFVGTTHTRSHYETLSYRNSAADVDAFQLYCSSGNISTAEGNLFGWKVS